MPSRLKFLWLILLLLAGVAYAQGPSVSASHVWIRNAPPGVDTLAAYLTLTNHTGQALTLSTVSSTDFKSVAVHRTLQNNGMESMEAVPHLSIPAHQSVKLAPGGYHLMLMQPIKPLYDGDLVMLTFTFSDHSSLSIMAPVRRDAPQS